MAELIAFPDTDLAGVWELTQPLPVDAAGYSVPSILATDTAVYSAEDSASDALQPDVLTLPTVLVDDVAVIVAGVADGTETAELTGGDAPFVAGTDEVQTITSYQTSGTFTITFDGQTTAAIAWDASAATIQTELEALSNIAAGEAVCTGGDLDGAGAVVTVSFALTLAASDLAAMTTSVAYVAPVDEVQTLSSDRTGGTFTLTHETNTTTALAWNATAATIEAALEALAHLDPGDVVCTGGGLPTDVLITFGGAQAGADVSAITVTDSGTGGTAVSIAETTAGVAEDGQTITTTIPGVAQRAFALNHSINIARGGADQPQVHVWWLALVAADSGKNITATMADADGQHTWAAHLLVIRNADTSDPLETEGTEVVGSDTGSVWGAVTPATSGSVTLAIAAKALASGSYYTAATEFTTPNGYTTGALAESDAMLLATFISGSLSTAEEQPEQINWGTTEAFALGLITIKPATAAASGSDLFAVVDGVDKSTWIDIGTAAGSMFEVLELDLGSLPVGAVMTGVSIELAHACSVKNRIRMVAVGIDGADAIDRGAEQILGYVPSPVNQVDVVETAQWVEFASGSKVSDYSRLGVALFSSDRHPALSAHQVYWVRATVEYEAGGPVVSAVVGPTTPGDPISWVYSSESGLSQSHYQVMIISGAGEDPDTATEAANALDPSAGEIIYDSGKIAGDLVRALSIADRSIGRGDQTAAVRSWAKLSDGTEVSSSWDTDDFNITGTPATTPPQPTQPVFDEASGGVDVEVVVPAAVSRAWLYRSADSGATWAIVDDSPFDVTASGTETLTDFTAPHQATALRYEVSFDAGAMTETGAPEEHSGGDVSTPAGQWYLLAPDNADLNTQLDVKGVSVDVPVKAVTAEQPGNSVSATSLPLAARISLQLWVRDATEVAALQAILSSGLMLRLVNIWGQEWSVRNISGVSDAPQRWRSLPTETTGLRDAHVYAVELREESGS